MMTVQVGRRNMARMPPTWGMKAASPQTSRKAMKRCRWKVSRWGKKKRVCDACTWCYLLWCYSLLLHWFIIYILYIHIVYIYTYVYYMIYLTLFDITWYYYLMFVHSFDIDISYFYALLLSYYENAIYFFPSWFFVACCSAAYQSIRSMLGWFIEIHQSGLNLLGGLDDSHWKVWPRHLARQQRIRFFFATTVSEVQKAMQFWYLLITSWSGRNHSLQFGIIFDHFFLSIWKTPLSMWNSMISQK